MEQLKKRWGINSNLDIVLILLVFAINGSFAAWVAEPATNIIGLSANNSSPWLFWPIRIILVFVIYQCTLPIVGFCFGQFSFFWNFTRKMLSRMGMKWLFGN